MNTRFLKHFRNYPVGYALLAAILFGLNAPLSKLLLSEIPPLFMAAFLYLGAGAGILLLHCFSVEKREAPLSKKELPWAVGMILLDVAAPVLLMYGLKYTSAANASLLFNFEMVATSLMAFLFFKEAIGPQDLVGTWNNHARKQCADSGFHQSVRVGFFKRLSSDTGSLLLLGFGEQLHKEYVRKVSGSNCYPQGLRLRIDDVDNRFRHLKRGQHYIAQHHLCHAGRFYCIRIKHLFLCKGSTVSWSGTNECLLCSRSVRRRIAFGYYSV